jgi:hypothetical protein
MTSRRKFLQTGAAVTALPFAVDGLTVGEAGATATAGPAAVLHAAIVDDRYAQGLAFARTVAALGVAVRPLATGDVTDIYRELDVAWRSRPFAIAGLTQWGPMFVLERLARERGLAVALRVEHRPAADGTLVHVLEAEAETLILAAELRSTTGDWSALMAALVCRCSATGAPLAATTLRTRGPRPELQTAAAEEASYVHYYTPLALQQGYGAAADGPLYSWVVAPAARA